MNIEDRVIRVTVETLGVHRGAVVSQSTAADLSMDSLDNVELIMAIELEFSIEIPDADCEPITGVPQLVEYVTAQLS